MVQTWRDADTQMEGVVYFKLENLPLSVLSIKLPKLT